MVPLVSVLIPAHNAARWIEDAIGCALGQSWPRIEVILVDDGSTDETLAIARRLQSDRLEIISQDRQGGNVARNVALAHATGDFIQYLDADDVMEPDKIALQMSKLARRPADWIATCSWARFVDRPPRDARLRPEPVWRDLQPAEWLIQSNAGGGMMPPHAWLAPRRVIERAGPWAPQAMRNQDGEYFARVVLASAGVAFVEAARAYYRSHPHGWSRNSSRSVAEGLVWSIQSITDHLLQSEDSPRARLAMAASFNRAAVDLYGHHPALGERALAAARRLGAPAFRPNLGGVSGHVARIVGWRLARRLQGAYRTALGTLGARRQTATQHVPQRKHVPSPPATAGPLPLCGDAARTDHALKR